MLSTKADFLNAISFRMLAYHMLQQTTLCSTLTRISVIFHYGYVPYTKHLIHCGRYSVNLPPRDSIGLEWRLNVGIWGIGPTNTDKFVNVNRQLEQKVHELRGKKWLYYTEEEFWAIYEQKLYDALRPKYHATYLPSVY